MPDSAVTKIFSNNSHHFLVTDPTDLSVNHRYLEVPKANSSPPTPAETFFGHECISVIFKVSCSFTGK